MLQKGMKINALGTSYKVIASRPNGKITMKATGNVLAERLLQEEMTLNIKGTNYKVIGRKGKKIIMRAIGTMTVEEFQRVYATP